MPCPSVGELRGMRGSTQDTGRRKGCTSVWMDGWRRGNSSRLGARPRKKTRRLRRPSLFFVSIAWEGLTSEGAAGIYMDYVWRKQLAHNLLLSQHAGLTTNRSRGALWF